MLYLTSTSNHNREDERKLANLLCYILLLHQTTTVNFWRCAHSSLCYILLLHQTTTHTYCHTTTSPHHFQRAQSKNVGERHASDKNIPKIGQNSNWLSTNRALQNFPISVEKLSYKRIFTIIGESFSDHLRQFSRSPKKVWTLPKAAFSLLRTQVALASVDIFHSVTATEEHVRHGWHYLVSLVAVVGRTANTKSAVDNFVKWKHIILFLYCNL